MRHLSIIYQTDSFVQTDLCAPCGGLCCQHYPGAAFPEDFGPVEELQENLLSAFMTGRWVIMGSRGDGYWYVHPAFQGAESATNPFWMDVPRKSACTFWSQNGCEIFQTRPRGCRGLEPKPALKCAVQYGGTGEATEAWRPYQKLLRSLLEILK